jgi:aminoglycoside phosphotransferase (APT) family kinase protein
LTTPVDIARLTEWMDAHDVGNGALHDVALIGGGTQNILMSFTRGGQRFVLRRPPLHKRANSDETMRREARVLTALASTGVPHPLLVAHCPDVEPLGAAFYLMEEVVGFSPWDGLPETYRNDRSMQLGLGFAMVDALIALAQVDVESAGLADLGRGESWLERQVPRWSAQLRSYAEIDGQRGPRLPHVDVVTRWLSEHVPAEGRVGLVHGDFHFGNVLVDPDQPRVVALVDWELATVGDPLLDLGQLLATWPVPGTVYRARLDAPGLPTVDDVVARYVAATGRGSRDVHWFHTFACFRLGVLLEGTHARAGAGHAPRSVGETLHTRAVGLLQQAADLTAREAR